MKKSNKVLINELLEYIDKNLEYIKIFDLIEKSGFSYFHFHRIFKAYQGESIKQYIKRKRLEKAANKINSSNNNITNIALSAGYNTPSAFNKAFKDFFGVSPTKYKEQRVVLKEYEMIAPEEIKVIEPIEVYSIKHNGAYNKIGSKFETLVEFAFNTSILNKSMRAFAVYYDDPTITKEENLKSEACILKSKDVEKLPDDISLNKIEGGKYAIFLHEGSYAKIEDKYQQICSTYIKENDLEFDNKPCFEEYLNSPSEVDSEDELKTLIYIPIK